MKINKVKVRFYPDVIISCLIHGGIAALFYTAFGFEFTVMLFIVFIAAALYPSGPGT